MKNEEIKEILECLKKHDILSASQDSYLLDYITNIQQENENLKQTLHNITINGVEEENTTVLDLIKENKRLNNMIYREISDYILKKYGMLDDTHYHDFLNELELKESGNNE